MKESFNFSRISYYAYTPKDLKPQTYLLKGLNSESNTQEIEKEILELAPTRLKILKITHFKTIKSKPRK